MWDQVKQKLLKTGIWVLDEQQVIFANLSRLPDSTTCQSHSVLIYFFYFFICQFRLMKACILYHHVNINKAFEEVNSEVLQIWYLYYQIYLAL